MLVQVGPWPKTNSAEDICLIVRLDPCWFSWKPPSLGRPSVLGILELALFYFSPFPPALLFGSQWSCFTVSDLLRCGPEHAQCGVTDLGDWRRRESGQTHRPPTGRVWGAYGISMNRIFQTIGFMGYPTISNLMFIWTWGIHRWPSTHRQNHSQNHSHGFSRTVL